MNSQAAVAITSARAWRRALDAFKSPNQARSVFELTVSVAPFATAWAAACWLFHVGLWWASLPFIIAAAMFLVRLFMIQHDCGHGAFFNSRFANDGVGRVLGVLTLTPYGFWRRTHAIHHATSGDLARRGVGDVDTLTITEYGARSRLGRLRYRLYRHPFVMFGLGPVYLFFIQHRLPVGLMRDGVRPWLSTMGTNVAIAIVSFGLIWLLGAPAFFFVHLPTMAIAASLGVWLFFVQHQFEQTSWSSGPEWTFDDAALHGSSHYDLPPILRWMTANVGVHHVHHLSSRIPFYRLQDVLRAHPELRSFGRVTLRASLACPRLTLWDETQKRLISFAEAGARQTNVTVEKTSSGRTGGFPQDQFARLASSACKRSC